MTYARSIFAAALLLLAATTLGAQQPQVLTLKQAIEMAQRQGAQGRIAENNRDAGRDRDHAFSAGFLPQLSLSGTTPNYFSSITPVIQPDGTTLYLPLQETDAGLNATLSQKIPWTNTTLTFSSGLNQTKITGINGFQSWSSTPFSVGLSQPLLHSNSQMWDIKQQTLRIESSERKYLEAREDAAIAATGAFFALYAADANVKNAQANVQVNDTLYSVNKSRLEIGKIGENDLLQSELALLRARASLSDATLNYERTLAQFRVTINVAPGTPIELVVNSEVPEFDADTAAAVRWARANSSTITDVVASQVQADLVGERGACWNGGAGGTIQASYGFNGTSIGPSASPAYSNLLNAQHLNLQVSVPVWQWGAHSSTVDAAKADRDAAKSNAELSRAQVDINAHFAALQLTETRLGLVIAAKADTVARKRYEVAYNRYVIGKITPDVLILAEIDKDQSVVSYAQALRRAGPPTGTRCGGLTLYDFETGKQIREMRSPGRMGRGAGRAIRIRYLMIARLQFCGFRRIFVFWMAYYAVARFVFLGYEHADAGRAGLRLMAGSVIHGTRMDLAAAAGPCLIVFPLVAISVVLPRLATRIILVLTLLMVTIVSLLVAGDTELFRNWGFRLDGAVLQYLNTPSEMVSASKASPVLLVIAIFVVLTLVTALAFVKLLWPTLRAWTHALPFPPARRRSPDALC